MARAPVLFAAFSFVALTEALVHRSTSKTEQKLHRCSLHEHTQEELKALWGKEYRRAKAKAMPCGSFLEISSTTKHRSRSRVTRGVDYLSFIDLDDSAEKESSGRQAVWVSGYPRSGSSTILSMVTAAGDARDDSKLVGQTFSVFEPCHDGDAYTPWLEAQGCSRLLAGLTRCDFDGIEQLWGWPDSHTTSNHTKFSPEAAKSLCESSRITAFKTVDYGHNISEFRWFLDEQPQLRIIDIVRDPRGIFASWKTTKPFDTLIGTHGFYSLTDVCDTFASNLDVDSANVYHVVFEELTRDPLNTMRKVYEFLGLPFERAQERWVAKTFNAAECPEPKPWEVGFTDCHQDSAAVAEKWHTVLSDEEKQEFADSPSCQRIVEAYGFSKE